MKRKILSALVCAAMAVPVAANAGEMQISGGGMYLFDSADTEFSFTAATLRGAYYFTETFGLEAEGSLGLSGADDYAGSGIDFSLENQFGIYAIGRWPTSKNGEFFGRIGGRGGKFGITNGVNSTTETFQGFSIGAGYSHFFGDDLGFRAEVTTSGASLDGGVDPEGNLTSVSVSMTYRFGGDKK